MRVNKKRENLNRMKIAKQTTCFIRHENYGCCRLQTFFSYLLALSSAHKPRWFAISNVYIYTYFYSQDLIVNF